jgi:type IV pilus assembly protein PilO
MKTWPWYGSLVLALIIFALVFFFYFKPKDQELKDLRTERQKIEQEVQGLRIKKEQLVKIEAELVSLKAILKELEVIIPQKKEISEILRRIQQLAFDARLDILKFAPGGEIKKDFFAEWPIPIEVTGNYHNLAIFFDRLSLFDRIFNVEDFAIRSTQTQSDALTITSGFTAKTYYFIEEPVAPPSAQIKPGERP